MPEFVLSVPAEGGRTRWLPDGSGVAFTAPTPQGRLAIYTQPFQPGRDTSGARRLLPGLDLQRSVDSFGFAPDGTRLCVSVSDQVSHLMLAEGVTAR
jgi:Tol biopolymer transport system component